MFSVQCYFPHWNRKSTYLQGILWPISRKVICGTYINSLRAIWRTFFVSKTRLASYKFEKKIKIVQATSCRLYTAMSVTPVRYFKKTFNILFLSCVKYGVNIIAIFVSFSHSTGQSGNARVTEFRFSKHRRITSRLASKRSSVTSAFCQCRDTFIF